MNVQLQFFASLRELLGTQSLEWSPPVGSTVSELYEDIARKYPTLAPFRSSLLFAVNERYVSPKYVLQAGDVVAFLPPVSGG